MLLRLGLGNSTLEKEDISTLQGFTQVQWEALKETAVSQGVAGIAADGLRVILNTHGNQTFDNFEDTSFWRRFILKWVVGTVEQGYVGQNKQQLRVIDFVQKEWEKEGIRMMVMKGQANGSFYPVPMHRCPGDIDCYLFDDYAKGNEVAKIFADKVDESWYKHSQILIGGQVIENHQYFVHTREGKCSKELNQVLVDQLRVEGLEFKELEGTRALLPPPMFNALFLTYHAMSHFLEEGLKLKQVLDWAMFLKRDADKVDWKELYRICDKFHMHRFADVTTDIAVNYLGVELNNPTICSTSPFTEKVLQSTLYDKDYVFSSGEGGWSNRWHIVRNLFKYRWKYHQIYQHSVLRQLWWYAVGYVFKTE